MVHHRCRLQITPAQARRPTDNTLERVEYVIMTSANRVLIPTPPSSNPKIRTKVNSVPYKHTQSDYTTMNIYNMIYDEKRGNRGRKQRSPGKKREKTLERMQLNEVF